MTKSQCLTTDSSQSLQRFWIAVDSVDSWYAVMQDLRESFGQNWQAQSRVRRKFTRRNWYTALPGSLPALAAIQPEPVVVWFRVPDVSISTWISVKRGLTVWPTKPKLR
jgi:hypothetical protein